MLHLIPNFSIKNHEKKEKTFKKIFWWINPPLSGETHPARKISVAAACQVCTSLKVSTRSTSALEAGENGRTPRNKWLEQGQRISLANHFAPPNLVGDRSNPPSNKVIPVVSTKVQDSGEPSSALFAPEQVATSATFSSFLHCQLATQIDQVQPCEPPC